MPSPLNAVVASNNTATSNSPRTSQNSFSVSPSPPRAAASPTAALPATSSASSTLSTSAPTGPAVWRKERAKHAKTGQPNLFTSIAASAISAPIAMPSQPETVVPSCYQDYAYLFDPVRAERLPPLRPGFDMKIELIPGVRLVSESHRRYSPQRQAILEDYVAEGLRKGYLEKCMPKFTSPMTFVAKSNGSLRPCMDTRVLNAATVKHPYPTPDISVLLDNLSGSTIFTKFDLTNAFWQLRMDPASADLTAFSCNGVTYRHNVCAFGLTAAPAYFQRFIAHVLEPLKFCADGFFDDIIIFSRSESEHVTHVRAVLEQFAKFDLYLSPKKCLFHQDTVTFLGVQVSADGISVDPSKVSAVVNWPRPTTVKNIQEFLGFANFMRRSIQNFSGIVRPLTRLTRKDTPFVWSVSCEQAFERIKAAIVSAPVLVFPDCSRPFEVFTDASDIAIGAVLVQRGTDNKRHPVAFMSRSLSDTESRWTTFDQELLAIVEAMTKWRHYVQGVFTTIVWSDHANLVWFTKSRELTDREARWSEILAEFNFEIRHISGVRNRVADALSRSASGATAHHHEPRPLLDPSILVAPALRIDDNDFGTSSDFDDSADSDDDDDSDHVDHNNHASQDDQDDDSDDIEHTLDSEASDSFDELDVLHSELLDVPELPDDLADNTKLFADIRAATANDPEAADLDGKRGYALRNGLLRRHGRIFVPKPLRTRILFLRHDAPLAGHGGVRKTLELVTREFTWPGIVSLVTKYVSSCDLCQRAKTPRHASYGPLMPIPAPERPFSDWSVDFITDLPRDGRCDSIMVCIDRLTRLAHFVPTTKTVRAADAAQLFMDNIVRHHGLPDRILSDRGPQFVAKLWKSMWSSLNVDLALSSAYHAQGNGLVERVNANIEVYLRMFVNDAQHWLSHLSAAEFVYNNTVHSALKTSPFFAAYGRHPRMDVEVPPEASSDERAARLVDQHRRLRSNIAAANERYARAADRHRHANPPLSVGQKVWLLRRNIKSDRPVAKLDFVRVGPYEITKVVNANAYRLDLPDSSLRSRTFHVSLLEVFKPNELPDRLLVQRNDDDFVVERILDSDARDSGLFYLIRWQHRPASDDSWEPADRINDIAPDCVRAFDRRRSTAVRALSPEGGTMSSLQSTVQ